jgi:hypothetical protein
MSAETTIPGADLPETIKIETIAIDGYKGLRQFRLDPEGKSVEFSGKNGQGKSSVIEGLWVTLTGKDAPGVAINKEGVSASVVVGLTSGHTAKLRWTGAGKKLIVEGPDGEPVKAPARFLETLIGQISCDPFDFARQRPGEQKAFLQALLKLDFSDIEARKATALSEKRDLDAEDVQISRNLEDLVDAHPTERVDVDELLLAQEHRNARIHATEKAKCTLEAVDLEIPARRQSLESIETERARLLRELASLKEREDASLVASGATQDRKEKGLQIVADLETEVAGLIDPSEAIRNAGETNKASDAWDKRLKLTEDQKTLAVAQGVNAKKLKDLESEREQRLFSAKFPVEGLSFSSDGVLFRGLPFDESNQCTSDIIKVGVGIAIAQNPRTKIIRIGSGERLDSESRAKVLKTISAYGFQAFIEVVKDEELKALVIEETEGE